MGGFTVDPMEEWAADTDEPRGFSVRRVAECDLCVLLVALRRGYVPEGRDLSITQLEYEAAIEYGFDVLVFMLDDEKPWPRHFDETATDPGVLHWRDQLLEERGVGRFDHDPKSIQIEAALNRWLLEKYRQAIVAMEELKHIIKAEVVNQHDTYRRLNEVLALSQETYHRLPLS
jgi:hypothetical protein